MYSSARSRLILIGVSSWMPLPSPWERMLVSAFALHGLTAMSSGRGILADDHAGVDGFAGADEELAAFLDVVDGKAGRLARFHGKRARRSGAW